MEKTYLSCADTAKLIRASLKKAFPTVKFSVKSHVYSGGASINIGWTDGPTGSQVKKITDPFEGAGFDGMIDMKYNKDAWLMPDGTVTYGSCRGTEGSRGTVSPYDTEKPHPDARKVSFGADFIFENRHISESLRARIVQTLAEKYCGDAAMWEKAIAEYKADQINVFGHKEWEHHWTLQTQYNLLAAESV